MSWFASHAFLFETWILVIVVTSDSETPHTRLAFWRSSVVICGFFSSQFTKPKSFNLLSMDHPVDFTNNSLPNRFLLGHGECLHVVDWNIVFAVFSDFLSESQTRMTQFYGWIDMDAEFLFGLIDIVLQCAYDVFRGDRKGI